MPNKTLSSKEILEKYIKFYEDRGHKLIPNVSLVPENDPSLLFVNSGMFPLVPYLSGEPHPMGKRLVNVQRAIRFDDLDEIGDPVHTLAFHMIGNWSLGDYFKDEQLPWAYEFLVEVLGLDPQRLYASVFIGDEDAPEDKESIKILQQIFLKYGVEAKVEKRIFRYGKKENWWQRGESIGELGGPDSEVFYYISEGEPPLGVSPADNPDEFVEIGNSVFMQYKKTETGWEELPQKNVDFGGGLERIAMAVQNKKDIFETDNFWPIIQKIEEITGLQYFSDPKIQKHMRIIADHMRSAVFMAMDGVFPSNKEQGYALRRLIRRMVRSARALNAKQNLSASLVEETAELFEWIYPDLRKKTKEISEVFSSEEEKFRKTLERGALQIEKLFSREKPEQLKDVEKTAEIAFDLFQSLGYPQENFWDELEARGINLDWGKFIQAFDKVFEEHQKTSRAGAEQKFKGGLADHSEEVVRYHTATHLLQMALRKILGDHVRQLGSNITGERLRFDFSHPKKLTDEEVAQVEKIVNSAVKDELPVNFAMMPKTDAMGLGALYMDNETYPDEIKVYFVGGSLDKAVSKEFCGGPHVSNTKEIGELEIFKCESIGEGKQRIYARTKS